MAVSKNKHDYDLEERTAKFGEAVIKFCQSLKQEVRELWRETQELTFIFGKIISSMK
ncbi:MAG: hypothetical protein QMC93_02510 [Patescibacteria group bacterium]|nr:hypothetical protein [Patescibacteria group bacterium]